MTQPTKPRAVLYARVSSAIQAGEDRTSLNSQIEACRQLAERQDWEVIGEIRDDVSGFTLDRPGLDDVRWLVREGSVDIVVAHKQERLSRSQADTGILYSEFTKAGVKLWTVQEGTF